MNRQRVLLVMPDGLENAGVQNVVMSIVRNLNKEYSFDVILNNNEKGHYEEEFLAYGGRIFRVPKYKGSSVFLRRVDPYIRWIKNYAKIKTIISKYGPYQVIHCNNDIESFYIVKIAHNKGIPIRIVHTHVSRSEIGHRLRKTFNAFCKFVVERHATKQIGCSELACKSTYGSNAEYAVVNNPYNNLLYNKNDYAENKSSGQCMTIIQVGSYCDNKNQKFSIGVVSCIKKKLCNVKLYLVGFENQVNYRAELIDYARELGVKDDIVLLPHDSNIAELLNYSSYMLFPSHKEGFGLVLIEAQAMGVRCFVSDSVSKETNCGGCVYLPLKDGEERWADCILNDYKLTNGCHEEYDCSQFTADAVCERFRELYGGNKQDK